jgi:hypothetical protein
VGVEPVYGFMVRRINHNLPNSFVPGFQFRGDRSVAWRCDPMIVRLDAVSGSGNNSEQYLFVTGFLIDGFIDKFREKVAGG